MATEETLPNQVNWLKSMNRLIEESEHYHHPLQSISGELVARLKEYYLRLLDPRFFEAIIDHAKVMTGYKALLKLIVRLPEVAFIIKKELVEVLSEYGDYLAQEPSTNAERILEINELISQEWREDRSLPAKIAIEIGNRYSLIHQVALGSFYRAYGIRVAENPHADFVLKAQKDLAHAETDFLVDFFCDCVFFQKQMVVAFHSQQFEECFKSCAAFVKVAEDLFSWGDLTKSQGCYQRLYQILSERPFTEPIAEVEAQRFREYLDLCYLKRREIQEMREAPESHHSREGRDISFERWKYRCESLANKRQESAQLLAEQRIEQVLSHWTASLHEFIATLCDEVAEALGPAPCEEWAFLRLGSLARGEACLYSDLEFALVWGEPKKLFEKADLEDYFKAFVSLLQLKILSLGETNQYVEQTRGKQYHRLAIMGGLQFDDGEHYPFSAKGLAGTIPDLSKILNFHSEFQGQNLQACQEELGIGDDTLQFVLLDTHVLYGDSSLVKQFQMKCQEILQSRIGDEESCLYQEAFGYGLLKNPGIPDFAQASINLKVDLIHLPQRIIASFALFYGIIELGLSSFKRLEALRQTPIDFLNPAILDLLQYTLELAFLWRMRAHQQNGCEYDEVHAREFFTPPEWRVLSYLTEEVYPYLLEIHQAWTQSLPGPSNLLESSERILNQFIECFTEVAQYQIPYAIHLVADLLVKLSKTHNELINQVFIESSLSALNKEPALQGNIYHNVLKPLLVYKNSRNPIFESLIAILQGYASEDQQAQHITNLVQFMLALEIPTRVFEEIYQEFIKLDRGSQIKQRFWRYCFYETLERLVFSQEMLSIKFASVLEWMREAPDACGYRLSEYVVYQHLEKNILLLDQHSHPVDEESSGIRACIRRFNGQIISLHPQVIAKIIRNTGHLQHLVAEQKASSAYQDRNVAFLEYPTEAGVVNLFFKEHPDFPIMAYANDILDRRLYGHGSTPNELVIFEVELLGQKITYPVLISLTVAGKTLEKELKENTYSQKRKDLRRLSECFILEMLKHPGDGFPRNYILTPAETGFYPVCVDTEQMFVNSFSERQLKELSVIYCLPEFQAGGVLSEGLDSRALLSFETLEIHHVLEDWLECLQKRELEYKIFEPRILADRHKDHPFILPMVFVPGVLGKLAMDLGTLKTLSGMVKRHSKISPKALFEWCGAKRLAIIYFTDRPKPALDQLKSISRAQSTASSREYLRHYVGESKSLAQLVSEGYTIERAAKEMERYKQASMQQVESMAKVTIIPVGYGLHYELDFAETSESEQLLELRRLIGNTACAYRELTIKNCSILNDDWLQQLLEHSQGSLKTLCISDHLGITERTIIHLAEKFPNLEVLVASGIGAKDISLRLGGKVVFRSLKELFLNHCEFLEFLSIKSDTLTRFFADDNRQLQKTKLDLPSLEMISLQEAQSAVLFELTTSHPAIADLRNISSHCQVKVPSVVEKATEASRVLQFRNACGMGKINMVRYLAERMPREEMLQAHQYGITSFLLACHQGRLESIRSGIDRVPPLAHNFAILF